MLAELVQLMHILGGQPQGCCLHILFEVGNAAGARNGYDVRRVMQEPAQGNLPGRNLVPGGHEGCG